MAAHLETLIEAMHAADEAVDYLNRELSWLDFNARVLALADAPTTPLLERAKFLAIYSQNLDEFFQVRVAALKDQVAAGLGAVMPDGLAPDEQLVAIRARVLELARHQERIFHDEVVPALQAHGVHLLNWADLSDDDHKLLVEVFDQQVFPVLTPLAVDPGHPFPYISDLSLNLAVLVRDPVTNEQRFARVKVPDILPRFVALDEGERYLPLEQLIAEHLGSLFPGMEIVAHHPFRVIRNADLTLEEEEADDLLAAVEIELRRRRFGRAVRLEVNTGIEEEMLALLVRELDLADSDVYETSAPLDLGGLWGVWGLPRPDLKDDVFRSVTQRRMAGAEDEPVDLFARIREGDVLVQHPYDSFTTSVSAFIRQAAVDPNVLAIKQTLYRTSADSPIVAALIEAATEGKQVAALVELKARFDEKANVTWARALEQAGVHVVYGLVGLKTHTKIALVVRQDPDGIRRYCHIGTGNYNERTARTYEDLGLFTCDPQLGTDLSQLFNYLTGYGRQERFRKVVLAPGAMRTRIAELIAGEASISGGRITMKMNSLVDPELIDALYEASRAGTRIDLVVRGICCLRPGVPGLSETIRVRSIVGRFLEHSRIYHFANGAGPGEPVYLIGSADLMPRNLDRRVEVLTPIDDPALQRRLQQVLDVNLADDELAWELRADGSWRKVPRELGVDTHRALERLASERAGPPVPRPGAAPVVSAARHPGRPTGDGSGAQPQANHGERIMVKVALEREVKLAVWPGFALPALDDIVPGALAVPAGEKRQESVYFDTDDVRLGRSGITLRHRSDDGWTLKLPDDAEVRDGLARLEHTVAGDARTPPAEILALVASRVRTAALVPVARLQTLRRQVDLVDAEGAVLAQVVDDEVSVLEGRRVALRFREVEVEVGDDAPEGTLESIVAELRASGAGAPDPTPKVMRALGPRAQQPPELVAPELDRKPTAAAVLTAGLRRSALQLIEHDPLVRTTDDDEAVHQARVATRRLRSDLRTYDVLLDAEWVEPLRDELRWLADALGDVRDADVLSSRLRRQLDRLRRPDRVVGAGLLDVLGAQRQAAGDRLEAVLASPRYFALLDRVVAAATEPHVLPEADRPALDVLPTLMRGPWSALEKAAGRLSSGSADEELHEVRIRAKRARYAAEVAALVVGKPAQQLADEVARLQDVLGNHQDACVARDWLRRIALGLEPTAAFVAGELSAVQDAEAETLRAAWPAAWRRATKGRYRTWLKP